MRHAWRVLARDYLNRAIGRNWNLSRADYFLGRHTTWPRVRAARPAERRPTWPAPVRVVR